jgi:hypothetical protein
MRLQVSFPTAQLLNTALCVLVCCELTTLVTVLICRRQHSFDLAHAAAQQSVQCPPQQEQVGYTEHLQQQQQQQQDCQDAWQQMERPATPQFPQEQLRGSTGVLTPLSQCGSDLYDLSEEQCGVEPWAALPEGVFAEVLHRVSGKDAG